MTTEFSIAPSLSRFAKPDVWHLPATYWFWQHIPSREQIDQQLQTLLHAGYGSFQIATRISFPREEYLGEAYLAACRYTADQAAQLGLMMGVYDDYNWLSGHAGGKTVQGHDELRERHLFWAQADASTAAKGYVECRISEIHSGDAAALLEPGMAWIYEQGQALWDQWQIIGLYASPAAGISHESQIIDISALATQQQGDDVGFSLRVPLAHLPYGSDTRISLFVSARCYSSRMINYLLPAAAERFIQVGYQPYAEAFGPHFGTTVRYMFYDQPHACFYQWREHQGQVKSSLLSSNQLYRQLASFDGQIAGHLLALIGDIGERTAQRRGEFFETYGELGTHSFFGALADWCQQHQVLLSGHEVLGHVSSWDITSKIITDDARCNFAMDYFAIDSYRDLTGVDARNAQSQMAAKMGDSVARAHGRSGCLVEQYFACVLPDSHFAAGQWQVSLHELRLMALRHHILGARQFLMHAFWLSDGDQRDEVFSNPRFDFGPGINFQPWFSHHASFAQSSGRLSQFLDFGNAYGDVALFYPLRSLWSRGIDGDWGQLGAQWAQWLSAEGYEYHFVDEQQLLADGCAYRALVLPNIEMLASLDTLAFLERYRAAGGVIIFAGDLPRYSQQPGQDIALRQGIETLISTPDNHCYHADWPLTGPVAQVLNAIRQQRPTIDSSTSQPKGWQRVTYHQDQHFMTLFNDSEQTIYAYLRFSGHAIIDEWLIDSGEVARLSDGVEQAYAFSVPPYQVRCFALTALATPPVILLDHDWLLTDNQGQQMSIAVDRGWQVQGWPRYADIGRYQRQFSLPVGDKRDYELHLPQVDGSVEVLLNGVSIGRKGWPPFVFALPQALCQPVNQLTIVVSPSAANHYYADSRYQGGLLAPCGLAAAPELRLCQPLAVSGEHHE